MGKLRRVFSRRNLIVLAICYLVLWLLTGTLGVRQVRKSFVDRLPQDQSFVELAPEYNKYVPHVSWYSFRAVSYAPLVVAVKWRCNQGEFEMGGSGVVVWIGKEVYYVAFDAWMT
jgi:hypothetical protein